MGSVGKVFALVAVLTGVPAIAQSTEENWFDARIERILASAGVPGGAISVTQADNELYAAGYGSADQGAKRLARADTPFAVASVTKPMTAVATLMLVDEGKVSLDAPANQYLPASALVRDANGKEAPVTLRELLSHRSGLGTHYRFYSPGSTIPDIDAEMAQHGVIDFAQRGKYHYANWGYAVLQRVIERASGMTYADFLHDRLFEPLGMETAHIAIKPDWGDAAVPYNSLGPIPEYTTVHVAASGVILSMRDLAEFGHFVLDALGGNSLLLSQEMALEMSGRIDKCGTSATMQLGIIRRTIAGFCGLYHSGEMPGVSSRFFLIPDDDLVIATAANISEGGTQTMLLEALRTFGPRQVTTIEGVWRGMVHDLPVRLELSDSEHCITIGQDVFELVVSLDDGQLGLDGWRKLADGRLETLEGVLDQGKPSTWLGSLSRTTEDEIIGMSHSESFTIKLEAFPAS